MTDSFTTRSPTAARGLPLALLLAAAAAGHAAALAWTCDDFYLAARYARHWAEGHGLVFNPGEYVEGYTTFLWEAWLALGVKAGADLETWAHTLSVLCYAGSIGLLAWNHLRLRREGAANVLPLAALLGVCHREWAVYATSGLETSLYTFLLLAAFVILTGGEMRPLRAAGAGLVLGLAVLARPDGMIFVAVAGLFVLWRGTDRWRAAYVFTGAFCALWLTHLVWRLHYYEDVFPNTYYAKSGNLTWYAQGWVYVRLFFSRYWVLLLAIGALGLFGWRYRGAGKEAPPGLRRLVCGQAALAGGFAVLFVWYVWRLGGGFMFGRMLVPVVPFLCVLLELALVAVPERWRRGRWAIAGVLLAGLLFTPAHTGEYRTHHIQDERRFYLEREAFFRTGSHIFAEFTHGLPVRVLLQGADAQVAWRAFGAKATVSHGLTDRLIAHSLLAERGKVGHEKEPAPAYVVVQRPCHFTLLVDEPGNIGLDAFVPRVVAMLDRLRVRVLHWDQKVMDELRRRGARFEDFPSQLDGYLVAMDQRTNAEVARDFARFQRFYFLHNDDPKRENAFRRRLGMREKPLAGP